MTKDIRRRFIITADDYGIRQTAEPILRLAHEGKIDRVAVLIHYVSADQARALLAAGVKIDLHLEIIDLLRSGDKIQAGAFFRGVNFLARYVLGLLSAERVEREWRDQIRRFQEVFGRLPDGLNSHEHVHFFPGFLRKVTALAKEYHIGYVRFSHQGVRLFGGINLTGRILAFLWQYSHEYFEGTKLETSDYLVSLDWLSRVEVLEESPPEGTSELVVHLEREEDYRMMLEYF